MEKQIIIQLEYPSSKNKIVQRVLECYVCLTEEYMEYTYKAYIKINDDIGDEYFLESQTITDRNLISSCVLYYDYHTERYKVDVFGGTANALTALFSEKKRAKEFFDAINNWKYRNYSSSNSKSKTPQ